MNSDNIPLDIPNVLLKKPKSQNQDVIGTKHDFGKIEGNQFLQIEPDIVKFTGFEINQLNTIRVKIINKASIPQRINVLPMSSPFFSIKMKKKGNLASGMAEELFINFKPSEYKYYYDTIRINGETGNFLIPVHAFPVLDRENIRDIFPRLIDMGKVDIGDSAVNVYTIKCKIPINFQYEFVCKKDVPEIKINPIRGVIPGNSGVDIEVIFTPSSNITVSLDAQLSVSQFDFEPVNIRITGSGTFPNAKKNKLKALDSSFKKGGQSLKDSLAENGNNNFLLENAIQSKRDSNTNQQLDKPLPSPGEGGGGGTGEEQKQFQQKQGVSPREKLPEYKTLMKSGKTGQGQNQFQGSGSMIVGAAGKSMVEGTNVSRQEMGLGGLNASKSNATTFQIRATSNAPSSQTQQNRKTVELTGRPALEKQFIDKFNDVRALVQNKDIKFFQCIGDRQQTQKQCGLFLEERKDYEKFRLRGIQYNGQNRFQYARNSDDPIVEQIVPSFQSTWDSDKNDEMKRKEIRQRKFFRAVTGVVLKYRMLKRLGNLQKILQNCQNRQDVKKMVEIDFQRAEYAGIGQKDFIAFSFQFDENNIGKMLLPIQYEGTNSVTNFKYDLTAPNGFDDWASIDPINYCDYEVMGYQNWDIPSIIQYPPIETHRKNRKGAEQEYNLRGKLGGVENMEEELNQIIPKTFLQPIELEVTRFIVKHSCLRPYCQYSEFTQSDPQYFLQPEQLEIQDSLDPQPQSGNETVLQYEFLTQTPGYNSLHALNTIPIERTYYQPNQLQLPQDIGNDREIEQYCPPLLEEVQYDDQLTDDDSDGEGPPEIQVQDVNDLLRKFEDQQNIIADTREKSKQLIFDQSQYIGNTIDQNLEVQQLQWITTMPSKINDYNRFIQQNTSQMYII